MSEKTGTEFFSIDAFCLCQASKKPTHLEQRFRANSKNTTLMKAQLNREALLEARRQKLNRRFLEVQEVVNKVKARREAQRLAFLQSLEAAELNRNSHIEQRRAASKEMVERAKIIARQNALRFEAEQERLREALQSRLEKAHARKSIQMRMTKSGMPVMGLNKDKMTKKRSSGLDKTPKPMAISPGPAPEPKAVPEPNMHDKRRKAFHRLGLPSTTAPDTWPKFSELAKLLKNPKTIQVMAKLLRTGLNVKDAAECKNRTRILLSAYMMIICPREVFQDLHGVQEQQLLSAAKHLLGSLEIWLNTQDKKAIPAARQVFEESWSPYLTLFEAWKAKDMQQLVAKMSGYCLELERLKATMGSMDGVNEQLDQQIEQVKTQLLSLAGPTALEQLNETAQQLRQSSAQADASASAAPSDPLAAEHRRDSGTEASPLSPEQVARLLKGYAPAFGVSNEQLAHEIMIDPEFRLKKHADQSELETRVRMMATNAFFDQVTRDIEQGHPERSLPSLLSDVRERLLSLVHPNSTLHMSISETMDIDLIVQQMAQNAFDFRGMTNYVVQVMRQICAPVRDEAVLHIGDIQDNVQRLRAILETLDEMALDLANFRLSALRPHLAPIAVDYERGKFADALKQNQVGLGNTRQWLQSTISRLNQVASQRNPEGAQPQPKPSQDAILEDAFVSLLTAQEPIDRLSCPETFLLDVERLAIYQNETQAMTTVSALVMLAKNFGYRGNLNALADKLFIMLEDHSTTLDNLTAEIEHVAPMNPDRRPMIRAMIDKTLSHSDTVYSLLMRRIGSVIRSQLQTRQFVNHETLVSYGLVHVEKPLRQLCNRVLLLVTHHWQVYMPWYTDIITEILDNTTSSA